jgi:carbamoyl-phosphate synthase small subunit
MDPDAAVAAAGALTSWEAQDFVAEVSARDPYDIGGGDGPLVAILDFGLKTNIVRGLLRRGARVRVLPYSATAAEALAPEIAGIVLSPGPGDPARLDGPVALARAAIADGRPLLGICLGHQIVGLAAGGTTRRLRFGHHGANHPVQDLDSGRVRITAQNHEVEVVGESLPTAAGFLVSQRNLNDGSVEGLRHRELPIASVQYHPEGSPGPLDALDVFDRFVERVKAAAGMPGGHAER